MSTKIYQAWRVSSTAIVYFLDSIDRAVIRRAAKHFCEVAESGLEWPAVRAFSEELECSTQEARVALTVHLCIAASRMLQRCSVCLDFSLNLWPHPDGRFYVIPYGERWLKERLRPTCGQSYPYWNSTDKPRNLSQKAWDERARTWESVCLSDHDRRRLVHTTIDFKENIGVSKVVLLAYPKSGERGLALSHFLAMKEESST